MLLAEQPKIHLAIGLHNHQPVGNWDWVIEDAYQHAYLPFVECLEAHPAVAVSMHFTGFLLEWIREHHPEYLEKLRFLLAKGQLEILTGAHYEPILPVIPDRDKFGQVRRLTETIESSLGAEPVGMWLAERVWEPHLVKSMVEAGVRYTVLDDIHFKSVGLRRENLFGYYQTEEQGRMMEVFPINRDLRYLMPFSSPEKVIDYLRANATGKGSRLLVCFDDGEKFGCWPDTYQMVYLDGWLDRFFSLLEENADWIRTVTLQDYRRQHAPWGRVYIPSASYLEMEEWALPPDQSLLFEDAMKKVEPRYADFLNGGFWRHFLVKYPESNNLHKKMLMVSSMVDELPEDLPGFKEAQDCLWKGQSNDPYWHGVFGGLYLSNLRSANYSNLLKAETICDATNQKGSFLKVAQQDFDCDGHPEILVSTREQNCYFTLQGGSLFEWDYKPKHFNVIDTLTRRPEAYHQKIGQSVSDKDTAPRMRGIPSSKESGLEKMLYYDWYRRISLIDHFLHPDSFLESFYNVSYGEQGDYVNQHYSCKVEAEEDAAILTFKRNGHFWIGAEFWPINLTKRITIPREGARMGVEYTLENAWDRPVPLWFGVEFNANLLAGNAPDRYYYSPDCDIPEPHLASKGALNQIQSLGIRDEYLGIDFLLHWSLPATVWRFPIETISQSESGYEKVYQSSMVMPNWKIELPPLGQWQVRLDQSIVAL